jgi:23S rRNA pseudouridine1911/1915/1917 synthase
MDTTASSSRGNTVRIEGLPHPERVDRLAAALFPSYSRSRLARAIERGDLRLNGEPIVKSSLAKNGDIVSFAGLPEPASDLVAEDITLSIVYENSDFAVIDKPAGLTVHPTPQEGGDRGTLANALLYRYPDLGGVDPLRPGIVHRLDRDTSGLILVALRAESLTELQRLMHDRLVHKTYLALTVGGFEEESGYIESMIGRDPMDAARMTVRDPIAPRLAKTRFEVAGRGPHGTSLLSVDLLTGRTHQIRVHCASIGHAIVGDRTYGQADINTLFEREYGLSRQWLHAHRLAFEYRGESYEFASEPPAELAKILG